ELDLGTSVRSAQRPTTTDQSWRRHSMARITRHGIGQHSGRGGLARSSFRSSHPHRGYRFAAARTFRVGHYRWRVNTPDPAILDAPPSETIDPACSGVEVDGCLACIR